MELRKKRRAPKISRGICITQELHARIQEEADKFGLRWNEAAEMVLERAFIGSGNKRETEVEDRNAQELEFV